jgi:uncharacterized FlaG/YvyC family protein
MQNELSATVDDEWANFMLKYSGGGNPAKMETESFVQLDPDACPVLMDEIQTLNSKTAKLEMPVCGELHISTKTKVLFLNCGIDTLKTFWSIPVIDYWRPVEGVIKKQTKITSFSQEELDESQERLRNCGRHYTEMVIKNANTARTMEANTTSTKRLKFKDDRKVTIGISKKDIMNCRGKQKKAFMNCFAIIIRFKYNSEFREVHVKVFNTGKLEIPGVPDDNMLRLVREKVIEYLQPHLDTKAPLEYIKGTGDDGDEDVLINSGFHCGFCIDQKAFYAILRSDKYGIETSYDSCHYPGIRCKYYYRNDLPKDHPEQGRICLEDNGIKLSQLELSKKYTCVSFMIFSTGNCLVVGNCSKVVLLHVFEFIKQTLELEYGAICLPNESVATKIKKKKQRKKTVHMQMNYYRESC